MDDSTSQLLLDLAAALYGSPDLYPARDRGRYAKALMGVAQFLKREEAPSDLSNAFTDLAEALTELDSGTVRPFLRPTKGFNNRHIDGGDLWRGRARVSIAFFALTKSGMNRPHAGKFISRFKHLEPLCGKKANSLKSAALSWHDEFKAGKVDHKTARKIYQDGVNLIEAQSWSSAEQLVGFASALLEEVNSVRASRASD